MAHLAIDMFLLVLLTVLIMTDSFLSRRRWSSVSMSLSADEQRSIDTFNRVKSQCVSSATEAYERDTWAEFKTAVKK